MAAGMAGHDWTCEGIAALLALAPSGCHCHARSREEGAQSTGVMKGTDIDTAELERVEAAIHRLWEDGCPVAHDPPATARVALRRWNSVGRRHSNPNRETRINDVANGLIQAFERDPAIVAPLKRYHLCVAEAVAATVEEAPPN
jgi:hypothetical protein